MRYVAWPARRLAAVAVTVAVASSPLSVPHAHADSTSDASAAVQSLLAKVHSLQSQAEAAEARYQRALNSLSDSVNQAITDDQSSEAETAAEATAQQALDSRVASIYEAGGSASTWASVLVSGNAASFGEQALVAERVLKAQNDSVAVASRHAQNVAAVAARVLAKEHDHVTTARDVAGEANRVASLLTQQQALLETADHHLAAVKAAAAKLAAQTASYGAITTTAIAGLHILTPSSEYLGLYRAAAPTCPGLSWTVLAAIGQVESGHGRNTSASSAGAMGPMQFEPATFVAYAVDGDKDGKANIMDPADAIFTAAHYLCANGAGRSTAGLSGAILHYNHAGWYVEMVLKLAGMYATTYSS